MRRVSDRSGIAPGDALLVLATAAFVFAVAYPRLERAALQRRTEAVSLAVHTVHDAAQRHWTESGAWPSGAAPGTVPRELAALLPGGFAFQNTDFSLTWDRWDTVEALPVDSAQTQEAPVLVGEIPAPTLIPSPEVVPPRAILLGGITVHSGDPRVLAALLEEFGPIRSFVRGSAWTLVLTPRD